MSTLERRALPQHTVPNGRQLLTTAFLSSPQSLLINLRLLLTTSRAAKGSVVRRMLSAPESNAVSEELERGPSWRKVAQWRDVDFHSLPNERKTRNVNQKKVKSDQWEPDSSSYKQKKRNSTIASTESLLPASHFRY